MADEIEITPEMIEAGLEAFTDHRSDYATARECVEAVYRAMEEERTRPVETFSPSVYRDEIIAAFGDDAIAKRLSASNG